MSKRDYLERHPEKRDVYRLTEYKNFCLRKGYILIPPTNISRNYVQDVLTTAGIPFLSREGGDSK